MRIEKSVVSTKYGNIRLYKKGNGSHNLILLHGGGCDSAMLSWREVMNCFNDRFTVFAPDLLGYGGSDVYNDIVGENFYNIHVECLKEMVEKLKLCHFGLAGLSMGGAISIGYALKYPEYIDYLVLADSWGLSAKRPFHTLSWWYVNKTNFTLTQYRWMAKSRWLARWAISYSLIGNKKLISDDFVTEVMEACQGDMAGKSMLDFQRSSATKKESIPYYIDQLETLKMPVAFIIGEKDPLVPLSDVCAAKDRVKESELHIFEKCKHWTVREQPDKFCKIVGSLDMKITG